MDCPNNIEEIQQRLGLVDRTHKTLQIALWTRDVYPAEDEQAKRENDLCWAFKIAMTDSKPIEPDDSTRLPMSFEALSMSLFTRQLRMSPQAVFNLCGRLRAIVSDHRMPIYFNL